MDYHRNSSRQKTALREEKKEKTAIERMFTGV